MTSRGSLLPRRNSLNLIRLVLAALVVVQHGLYIPHFAAPQIGNFGLGGVAVVAFFAASGFLVTKSATHLSLGRYLWHRVLRIFPALLVVVTVTVTVLGPLYLLVTHQAVTSYRWGRALTYLRQNAALLWAPSTIEGTVQHTDVMVGWNDPLWTLKYEFLCYLAVLTAAALGGLRARRWLVPAVVVAMMAVIGFGLPLPGIHFTIGMMNIGQLIALAIPFGCGMTLALYEDKVLRSHLLGAASLVLTVLLMFTTADSTVLVSIPLTYSVLWLARVVPVWSRTQRIDLSYGVYIWGFPMQVLLVAAGVSAHGGAVLLLAIFAVTLPIAFLSFHFVERPALRLKSWTPVSARVVPAI